MAFGGRYPQKGTELFPAAGNPANVSVRGINPHTPEGAAILDTVVPFAQSFFVRQAHNFSLSVGEYQKTSMYTASGDCITVAFNGADTMVLIDVAPRKYSSSVLENAGVEGIVIFPHDEDTAPEGWWVVGGEQVPRDAATEQTPYIIMPKKVAAAFSVAKPPTMGYPGNAQAVGAESWVHAEDNTLCTSWDYNEVFHKGFLVLTPTGYVRAVTIFEGTLVVITSEAVFTCQLAALEYGDAEAVGRNMELLVAGPVHEDGAFDETYRKLSYNAEQIEAHVGPLGSCVVLISAVKVRTFTISVESPVEGEFTMAEAAFTETAQDPGPALRNHMQDDTLSTGAGEMGRWSIEDTFAEVVTEYGSQNAPTFETTRKTCSGGYTGTCAGSWEQSYQWGVYWALADGVETPVALTINVQRSITASMDQDNVAEKHDFDGSPDTASGEYVYVFEYATEGSSVVTGHPDGPITLYAQEGSHKRTYKVSYQRSATTDLYWYRHKTTCDIVATDRTERLALHAQSSRGEVVISNRYVGDRSIDDVTLENEHYYEHAAVGAEEIGDSAGVDGGTLHRYWPTPYPTDMLLYTLYAAGRAEATGVIVDTLSVDLFGERLHTRDDSETLGSRPAALSGLRLTQNSVYIQDTNFWVGSSVPFYGWWDGLSQTPLDNARVYTFDSVFPDGLMRVANVSKRGEAAKYAVYGDGAVAEVDGSGLGVPYEPPVFVASTGQDVKTLIGVPEVAAAKYLSVI